MSSSAGARGTRNGVARVEISGKRPLRPAARTRLRQVLQSLLAHHGAKGTLSVVFVGDDEIREVHRRFFGVDTPTDVVAFPLHDGDLLGEVVVSVDTARSESRARGLTLARELALYAIHGVLHVLGYDHDDRWERRQMRRMEREYLDRFPF